MPGSVERLLTLNVNGQDRRVDVMKQETLAMTLRYKLGLTGTKLGCDRSECGACTVLVDDVPRYSCSVLTHSVRGKKIGVQDFSGLLWSLTMLSLRDMGLDPQRDNISIQAIGDSTVIAQSLTSGIIDAAALDKLQSVRLQGQGAKVLLDLRRVVFPSSPFMGAEAFIEKNPQTVEKFIKALIEASTIMRAQKERGLAVLQKHIKTDRALAEIGYKNLLDDLTAYTFTSVKGLRTVQEIVALRDPKIAKYNVEDLLDQRILKKVVDSGYVEEIERRYKIRS